MSFQPAHAAQVTTAVSNFGEVGIFHSKMLSSKGILVFKPPQLSDRMDDHASAGRARIAPQVSTWVRIVAGSRYRASPAAR